jgi:hypothetical protein
MGRTSVIFELLNSESNRYGSELINTPSNTCKVKQAVIHRLSLPENYLTHQHHLIIECAATVICLIWKTLELQTENQFEKKTG